MKKLFFSLFAALLLSTSNMAAAACAYMNITSSGASLSAGDSQNVYEFSISCIGSVTFKFEDLSGNNPTSRIAHIIERRSGSSWSLVSSTTSNGARTVNRSFVPSATGQYRYRIENVGTSPGQSHLHVITPSSSARNSSIVAASMRLDLMLALLTGATCLLSQDAVSATLLAS